MSNNVQIKINIYHNEIFPIMSGPLKLIIEYSGNEILETFLEMSHQIKIHGDEKSSIKFHIEHFFCETKSEFIIIKVVSSRCRLSNEMRHIAILNELQNIKLNGRPEQIEVSECVSRALLRWEKKQNLESSYLKNASHDVSWRHITWEKVYGRRESERGNIMLKNRITKWPNKTRFWDVTTNRPTQRALIIKSNKLWNKPSRWHHRSESEIPLDYSILQINVFHLCSAMKLFVAWKQLNNDKIYLIIRKKFNFSSALHLGGKHLCN